jgi:adenosylmethionine-8-amino-7-oxononanoate aminotransferase
MTDPFAAAKAADLLYVWHPFTQMAAWLAREPLLLVRGDGAWLFDESGNRYLDGNSSIWTNLHGHNHPRINAAVKAQLDRVAHTSLLGFANEPAALLAQRLVELVPETGLRKVFFSDNGSTGVEVALKMALQYFQQNGEPHRHGFIAFEQAYHGDTFGASSLGGISLFHDRFAAHHFPVTRIRDLDGLTTVDPSRFAAVVIEPLVQGAAGMRLWPAGLLRELETWCRRHGVLLILDEVMTGFGRTGRMFAHQHERVRPDFLVLAKGLTGGYSPLAATLTTQRVFDGFLGREEDLRTFFYGHSYAGHALGAAAALANLDTFQKEGVLDRLVRLEEHLAGFLEPLKRLPHIRAVRQCGFMAGIELGQVDGQPFDWQTQTGARVCLAARRHHLLTRPIRDVVVLMLPYCVTEAEIAMAVQAIENGIREVLGN